MEKIACDRCGKKFNTADSLKQHQKDAHTAVAEVKAGGFDFKKIAIIGRVVLIFAGLGYTVKWALTGKVVVPITETEHIRGAVDAEVTIVEFSDFQCPFCGKVQPTLEQVLKNYNGTVRLVFKHFPLTQIHPYSVKAGEASECADEQGKFWEYHDLLFKNQNALGIAELKNYASQLGLDTTQFNDCLDSDKMADRVVKNFNEGQKSGVTGTPAFFINGQKLVGAQPYSAFQSVIEKLLSQ